jgi:hypothetical protein
MTATLGQLVAVSVAVHQPAPDRTLAAWRDSTPDLSCTDSTLAYCVDVEHQPTDLVLSTAGEGVPSGANARRTRRSLRLGWPVIVPRVIQCNVIQTR